MQPSINTAPLYSVIPHPSDSVWVVRRIDSVESLDEAHVDSMAPNKNTQKRIRFSEVIQECRTTTADEERVKCSPAETDLWVQLLSPGWKWSLFGPSKLRVYIYLISTSLSENGILSLPTTLLLLDGQSRKVSIRVYCANFECAWSCYLLTYVS